MEEKIRLLEERIERLEQEVQILKTQRMQNVIPVTTKTELTSVQPQHKPQKERIQREEQLSMPNKVVKKEDKPPQPKKSIDFEKQLGQVWLPRIFMFILLIGVLWGLKVGIDKGWITNSVRIVLGYAGTFILGWFGYRQYLQKRHVLGLSMLGGMIALGMLTTFAAHYLYDFFGVSFAFILNMLYVVLGIVLSHKTRSETLSVFAAVGAFLIPFLLENAEANTLLFSIYALVLFLSLFFISIRFQHKYAFYIVFALFHLTLFVYYNTQPENNPHDYEILAITVLIQHLFLLLIYMRNLIPLKVFSETLLYTNFVFGMSWMKLFEDSVEPLVFGGISLIYVILAIHSYKQKELMRQSILSAISVFAIGLFILSFEFEKDYVYTLLFLLNSTIGLWIALQFKSIRTMVTSGFVYLCTSVNILSADISKILSIDHLLWISLLISVSVLYVALYRYLPKNYQVSFKYIDMSLIAGQILSFMYLFNLAEVILESTTFEQSIQQHILSFIFLLATMAYYQLYSWKHGKYISMYAIAEIVLFSFSIFFVEMTTEKNELFFLNLLIEILFITVLFYICYMIRKQTFPFMQEFLNKHFHALAVSMQIILFAFLNKWFMIFSDQFLIQSDYIYLIHSLILLVYAFASISIGKSYSWKIVRIIGVVLIVLTILKLFFIDLMSVSLLVRAILFILVGVIGIWYSKSFYKE